MQLITLFISGIFAQTITLTNNRNERNTVSGTGCFGLGNGPYTGFNTNDNLVGEFFSQSNCQGSIIATGKRNNLWFGPVNAQSIRVSNDRASNPNAPSYYHSYDDYRNQGSNNLYAPPSYYHHGNDYREQSRDLNSDHSYDDYRNQGSNYLYAPPSYYHHGNDYREQSRDLNSDHSYGANSRSWGN